MTIKNNLLNVRGKGGYLDCLKTKKSKRTITLPSVCFQLLLELKEKQEILKEMYMGSWIDTEYVFKDEVGNYFNHQD